jgi:NADP-dependent aldehyde dehydrogenase
MSSGYDLGQVNPVQHDDAAFIGGGVGRRAGGGLHDDPDATELLAVLGTKVGRLTMHVGLWPATTRPESTSVGAATLSHLVRPVTFQSVSTRLLPAPGGDYFDPDNSLRLPRRAAGRREQA